jgi:AbrB family looped-hinge helix DNA binding protein
MATVTVSEKGWVVIPKDIRKRFGLKKGDKLSIVDFGRGIYLFPVPADPVRAAYGMFRGEDSHSIMQEFLEEKRRERDKEEADIARWGEPRKPAD